MVFDARLLLEIPREANRDMVQDAYRQKAWELHPDVCLVPDAAQRFCDLQEAFRILNERHFGAANDISAAKWSEAKSLIALFKSHPETASRTCALRRLVALQGLLALPHLFEAFDGDEPQLVWAAIHGFGRLGIRSSFPRIRSAFSRLNTEQRWAVLRFLPVLAQGSDAAILGQGIMDPVPAIAAYCRARMVRAAVKEGAHAFG